MKLIIHEIKDKEIWEKFLLGCNEKTFLSSWNWGEFNKMVGNKIWRIGIYEGDKLLSVSLVIKIQSRRGTFLFVPHGPNLLSNFKLEILKTLMDELKKIAKKEKASFIRVSPIWKRNEENIKIFKELGFKNAPIHMHPELTWDLDIVLSEEEILMKMRKTTRYLIRQAQKNKDIEIIQSPSFAKASTDKQNLKDIEKFNNLYQETVNRHHFVPFSLNYLKNEFLSFIEDNQISIFLGKYRGELVSSGIFIFWQGIGFYHHGASLLKYPKIPVSYLLQWEAIKEAKRRGCKTFNFWGIALVFAEAKTGNSKFEIRNSKFKSHPWSGLTLFKMGFGGYKKEYVKTQDFPISLKYWFTYIFEKLRKQKRGL